MKRFIKKNIKYIIIMAIVGFIINRSIKGIIDAIIIYIYMIFVSGIWYDDQFDD